MGKGLFANRPIPRDTIIGEYLGRLYPAGSPAARDAYVFLIDDVAESSALQYGNIVRFVNHHCRPNVRARLGMYGRRQVILYEAGKDIEAGAQLWVDYGLRYFYLPGRPCRCDAAEGDHVPGTNGPKKVAAKSAAKTKAKVRGSKGSARGQRKQKTDAASKCGRGNATTSGVSSGPGKSKGTSTTVPGKKHEQKDCADAVLKGLTRNAGVCRRYGPIAYTSYLRGDLKAPKHQGELCERVNTNRLLPDCAQESATRPRYVYTNYYGAIP